MSDLVLDSLRRSAEMAKSGVALQDMDWPNTVLFLLDRIEELEHLVALADAAIMPKRELTQEEVAFGIALAAKDSRAQNE